MRDKDLAGRGDRFIAEGRVVLQALLDAEAGSRQFVIEKALILENRIDGLGALLDRIDPACPVYVAGRDVLDAAVGFAMHRGILAVGRHVPAVSFASFLSNLPDQALLVAACGISNHDNIGGIFRNAGVFGADGIVLDASCCDPLYRKAIRVSVGAALRVPFCRAGSIGELVGDLSEQGFEVAGLSPHGAEPLSTYQPGRRLALLTGTEGEGLPAALLDQIRTLRIEQAPGMDSLNVATASGIALWHAATRMGRTGG
ncbi:RNA methyltransferase [Hoeflea sp. YIM 152468]|uniref:TrmH family RNA methyltransferase n=1 Tax=Hoeflea sp. YIM 152468 TaxID=3031759 RepID=UPI0023DB9A9E|nr:RNA methyltransferase [Hoeflea sp. YIM 152468]MDF1607980.1 RNA methyltransferase [Hoeflea sp. YIM 152468]